MASSECGPRSSGNPLALVPPDENPGALEDAARSIGADGSGRRSIPPMSSRSRVVSTATETSSAKADRKGGLLVDAGPRDTRDRLVSPWMGASGSRRLRLRYLTGSRLASPRSP